MGEKRGVHISLGQKIIASMLTMQVAVMTILLVVVVCSITRDTRNSTINNMKTIVKDRSAVIENYVKDAEQTLVSYSRIEIDGRCPDVHGAVFGRY